MGKYIQKRVSIENHEDYKQWRRYFAPEYVLRRDRRRMENGRPIQNLKRKKENFHYFKPSEEKRWKLKEEEPYDDHITDMMPPIIRRMDKYERILGIKFLKRTIYN